MEDIFSTSTLGLGLDDADVGKPISRDELFESDHLNVADEEAALILSKGLDDQFEESVESDEYDEGAEDEIMSSDEEPYGTRQLISFGNHQ